MIQNRWGRRCAMTAALTGLGAAILVTSGCGDDELPAELPPRAILWKRVSSSLASEQRVISGIVTSVSETRLAFEVGGTVMTVEANLGDQVESGRVLARLDPEPFELSVNDAEATLAQEVALQQSALADFDRARKLFEAQVSSQQEYDRAKAMSESRGSQVNAAQARLEMARRDLRRSVLLAPFSGSISVKELDPAMEVAGGQMVYEMDSGESGLRVEVQMPETLIAGVTQGAEVDVAFPSIRDPRFDAARQRAKAVVAEVGTRAGVGNAFPVRVDLVDRPDGVRPGMTAEVYFSMQQEDRALTGGQGFMIPISAALAEADDQFSVFVFDPTSSTVHKRPIRTGGVRDNDIAVLEGLSDGDILATAGVSFLREGQHVTLLDERLIRADR